MPTAAFLRGDFSSISPNGNCSLCSLYGIPTTPLGTPTPQLDALGRPMYANEIYDPLTRAVNPANNLGYANPFPNNVIPLTRIDNVAQKISALFPAATNSNLIGNYGANISGGRYTAIPSIKVDQNISDKDKLSFFYTRINTESQISSPLGNADGLPILIGGYRGTFIPTYTTRLNYDRTLAPTLLLHLGAGYYHTRFDDHAPFTSFVPSTYGLSGFVNPRQFPSFTGNCVIPLGQTACTGYGGMQNVGTSGQIQTLNYEEKPSFTGNLTWVKGNHTFQGGAELYLEQVYNGSFAGVTLNTGATTGSTGVGATAQPFTPTVGFNGFTQGFGYANFLLGDYTSTAQTPQENYRQGNQEWGMFIQDTWKASRKLTIDYGLRYDLSTTFKEQYGRLGQFAPNLANANAGGHPGATIFASTCGLPVLPADLSLRSRAAPGRGLSTYSQDRASRRIWRQLPVHQRDCRRYRNHQRSLSAEWDQSLREYRNSGRNRGTGLARHGSKPLPDRGHHHRSACHARRKPESPSARCSMEHRLPARNQPEPDCRS